MILLKRLRVLTAVLGVAAATAAVGTSLFGDVPRGGPANAGNPADRPDGGRVIDELAVTKFSQHPVVAYQVKDGDTLFAWQIKPALDAAPARPRDVLVLVDTSASQAGRPLQQARQILSALAGSLTADDRVSVWTVSTPAATKPLTKDFQPPASDDVRNAAVALTEVEYGSGAADLKTGLAKALATLSPNRGRQQLVVYLGDGESAFDPITEGDRVALGNRMDQDDVYFFAVPLGVKVNPHNLHGLASITGGTVVRVQEDLSNPTKRAEFVGRLKAAFDTPVLKADKYKFGDEIAEVYPTKLPPLRADKPALVMGKMARHAPALTVAVAGKVGTKSVSLNLTHPLPASQPDHFFLNLMLDQWRSAPHKDAPAMLQSDRALALASTQVKLYRDEFLTQAVWAITMDRFEDAAKLYAAARRIDPNDPEAAAGLVMVEKLKTGKITKAELDKKIAADADALKVGKDAVVRTVIKDLGKADANQPPPAGGAAPQPPPAGPPPAAADLIREAEARRRVEEQRYRVLVDATIRRARQLLRTDPDTAYTDLKRQRDEVLAYEGIGDDARRQMVADMEAVMREIFVKGAEIKRAADAERRQVAEARRRINEFDRVTAEEDRTKARIDAFRQLMQQARYELAYQEAQLMIQERIARGQNVPAAITASYIIGQQATQLREWRELTRIREDRFLLTMMQTEKSHIPYPDEPPVHFPPATVWRELTGQRRERYLNQNLGNDPSPTQLRLQSILENQRVTFEGNINDVPLLELLNTLSKKYDIPFVVLTEAFKAEGNMNIADTKPTISATNLSGMTLGNFLEIVLYSMKATIVVRPDYVEVTTLQRRLEEKVTRTFPVADLTIPIPSSVNQSTLFQNLFFQNQTLAIFGAASIYGGGLQQLGGFGGFGGGNPLQQGGGMGGGVAGAFPQGGGGNVQGNNTGFGGGFGGFGGGQLGQFGNLGGQFGLQGGDQSQLLMNLIFETVDKGWWANVPPPPGQPGMEAETPIGSAKELHSLGYYPPARALIVRGTSRYHPAYSMKLKVPEAGGAAAAPNPNRGGVLVIGPGGANPPANPANPGNGGAVATKPADPKPAAPANPNPAANPNPGGALVVGGGQPGLVDPKVNVDAMKKKIDRDPRRMWNQAIDWTVTDPGLIVACAEFMMEIGEFGHAAEILKAGLRKGLTTDSWAHDALAVALQMTQANPVEVERAAVSGIDLDPADSKAYLRAAKVESDLKNHDLAVVFCKRAAGFDPDSPQPYANALVYAEHAKDVKTDTVEWATGNLLKRDWPVDGVDYHQKAKDLLPKFLTKFEAAGIKADGVRKTFTEVTQRDLIIELLWQGPADLDLIVAEPTGSVCSATHARTTGGGVLKSDILEQKDENRAELYTAASAFTGTYKVTVKRAFGQPVGGKALVKVTRFKGTAKESHDLVEIDLKNPAPIEVKLDGGSRKELAAVSDDGADRRMATTGAPVNPGVSGMAGGFGSPAGMVGPSANGGPALPVVNPSVEGRVAGVGSAADVRAAYKVNPDRKTISFTVNPVFSTIKGDVAMPRVPLLPGGEK